MTQEGRGRKTITQLWWCLLSAALIVTSFPFLAKADSNLWPLAWIGMVPFFHVLDGASTKRGFWLGWFTGFLVNFGGFWWISHVLENFGRMSPGVAWPVTALNGAYQGLCFALAGWAICLLRPATGRSSVFRVAMIFTVVEFLWPLIFPWYFGNSQYRFLPIIQVSDVTGVMGVTFTLVVFNACVYELIAARVAARRIPWRMIGAGLGFVALVLTYGLIRLAQVNGDMEEAPTLKLGLVEADIGIQAEERKAHPNIEPTVLAHSHLLRYHRMSRELAARGVDLIVWPESSYLPVGYMHIKRKPDFAIAVTDEGRLAVWRDHREAGFQWSLLKPGKGVPLRAVAALREDAFVAVGDEGRILFGDGGELVRGETSSRSNLLAVAVAPTAKVASNHDGVPFVAWAVGEKGTLLGPQLDRSGAQVAVRATGRRLDRVSARSGRWTLETLRAVALVNALDGWAVGDKGTLIWIQKGTPRLVPTGLSVDLHGIAHNTRGVWIAGGQGKIWTMTARRTLREERTGLKGTLRAITSQGAKVVAAGDEGVVIQRSKSGVWRPLGAKLPTALRAVTIDALGVVWVADVQGRAWAFREGQWRQEDTPGLGRVTGLAALGYVRSAPMPRDAKYVQQSAVPIPAEEIFLRQPRVEFGVAGSRDVNAVQRGFQVPVLYGGVTWALPPEGASSDRRLRYNTAVMLDEMGRIVGTYDKNYLLMFGEYIPFGETFPVFYEWFPSGRFSAGRDVKVFPWRGFKIGVMICYEDILPQFTRRLADKDPNILINVTNDAWFGPTSEPYLHLALAVFRAVENRVVLVRATNTGVSAFVLPDGALTQQSGLEEPETLVQDVPMMKGGSIYSQIGDGFTYALMVWFAWCCLVRMRRRRRVSEPPAEAAA